MTIKQILAAALLGLAATAPYAHAEGEGNGDPFVFRAPGFVVATTPSPAAAPVAALPPTAQPPVRDLAQAPQTATARHL